MPHDPPLQIATPFAGAGQTLPQVPQLFTSLERLKQHPPQLVRPALQV
jgi:hypothetical protein